ncbi:transcription elongation factor 1 homolog [Eubalaena glacialis]|uniref:transcription elongation factor 1 homolog n=1 Tax=Eubalaena glacialis TaxID=27606 RepID=UPI002A5B00B8|nr:transcription elongation factor 1 homolog [Eubalaena glacialis]
MLVYASKDTTAGNGEEISKDLEKAKGAGSHCLPGERGCCNEGQQVQVCPPADVVRRKSKQKPPPKKKMTGSLDAQFTCPFCNHKKSCDMKMDRACNTGVISCTMCLEESQTPITYLSEPVDVYSDWIDSCEAANH